MLDPEDDTKAVIEVKVRLSEKYMIANSSPALQLLAIKIHCRSNTNGSGTGNVTRIRLGQKAFITSHSQIIQYFECSR